jgi:hypothetical protein
MADGLTGTVSTSNKGETTMGFWDGLMAGGIKGVAEGIGSLAKDIRAAITGEEPLTAEQKARLLEQTAAMEAAAQKAAADYDTTQMAGQIEINKIEAQSDSLFKSGWRPGLGWIMVAAFAVEFLARPLLPWFADMCGFVVKPMPGLNMDELIFLTSGMLGLGTMRSVEKIKKITQG